MAVSRVRHRRMPLGCQKAVPGLTSWKLNSLAKLGDRHQRLTAAESNRGHVGRSDDPGQVHAGAKCNGVTGLMAGGDKVHLGAWFCCRHGNAATRARRAITEPENALDELVTGSAASRRQIRIEVDQARAIGHGGGQVLLSVSSE